MTTPEFPRMYHPTAHPYIDAILAAGVDLAVAGAEEGTLAWACGSRQVRASNPDIWQPQPGGAACAVVLRPDQPLDELLQLNFVAAIALIDALAAVVAPMTVLRCGWPGDVYIGDGKTGQITLAAPSACSASPNWLVVAVELNVCAPDSGLDLSHAYVQFDGHTDTGAVEILDAYSRQMLSWLDRWANEGFSPIRSAWLKRVPAETEARTWRTLKGELSARFVTVDEQGHLRINERGEERILAITDCYRVLVDAKT